MKKPIFCAISLFLMLMGFRMISSMRRKRIMPPSKTGTGIRFKMARLILMTAMKGRR